MNEKIILEIVESTKINKKYVETVLNMLAEGNTVHFLARYRKEQIGGIDEEQIRSIEKVYAYQKQLSERKLAIKERIEGLGMLTDELASAIDATDKLVQLEQLYEPYKSKKITKAKKAIDGGLLPLAQKILAFGEDDLEQLMHDSINECFPSVEEVRENVGFLIAQLISENMQIREGIKRHHYKVGVLESKLKRGGEDKDTEQVFQQYYAFTTRIGQIANHQILAVNRAEKLKVINVKLLVDQEKVSQYVYAQYCQTHNHPFQSFIFMVIEDALKRLMLPSIGREIRSELTTRAETEAIALFGKNLQQLLMQQPLTKQRILGFDPAFRTGCKLAVLDENGKLLEVAVVYPHEPVNKIDESKRILSELFEKYRFSIIAIGNGTASRESERFVGDWISENNYDTAYTIVSEAGASVYSASKGAQQEFPQLSVEQRSAISIARRILDPLSELIKIDPKALGVGQYQHDLAQNHLNEELGFVVDQSVNRVGVDINSASSELLSFVSGITKKTAQNIVEHREESGSFSSRSSIKKVKGFGPKAFEQAAGFLRVIDGEEVLDNSAIHPESYQLATAILQDLGIEKTAIGSEELICALQEKRSVIDASSYNTDRYTIEMVIDALQYPQRDEREQFPAPLLRQDVLTLDDVFQGMELEGVVRNITDFGSFIDIGLKNDGFVHISKMSKRFISHPSDVVSIGDILTVYIDNIDKERNKIELRLV